MTHHRNIRDIILSSPQPIPVPIAVYPGLPLSRSTVKQLVTDPRAQFETIAALQQRFDMPVVMSAMDLSAEAEAFGSVVRLTEDEVPTVIGRRVATVEDIEFLPAPQPGDARTAVHLEAARLLADLPARPIVLGGMIGPFSLAARLFGVGVASVAGRRNFAPSSGCDLPPDAPMANLAAFFDAARD